MATYIVAYDLDRPGQKYDCLKEKLETYAHYWHFQQSVWIISTSESAVAVRDRLSSCLDSGDKLFVGRLAGEAAWSGYTTQGNDWLRTRLT